MAARPSLEAATGLNCVLVHGLVGVVSERDSGMLTQWVSGSTWQGHWTDVVYMCVYVYIYYIYICVCVYCYVSVDFFKANIWCFKVDIPM